ncbi:hypothetical protein GCM10022600_25320 [Qipengyuania pelagi]|jgi:hypothetical protein|uniref:Tetratricopeptide repeat protein n=1 Tax=Qipengyuania pelagi TaxID=994320 RepID=A0A844Y2F6_9SPHN|nr:hypothetical protein [Qipengyuania pelagi]MXO52630.1 hypothetical protein [Qipengyuania pelagi]
MFALAQITALALAAHTPVAMTDEGQGSSFGTQELVEGRDAAAIRAIGADADQAAKDPALLINLAIAHARRGDDARARDLFEAAMMHDDRAELETADGKWVDSRALARKGLAMLDRGAFASTASIASR